MAVHRSYAKLGVFVVVGLAVVLATAIFFVQRMRSRAVIALVTYTRDNVSGLDVSSSVRYRGVSIGRVSDVRIDPSGDTVEIDFEIFHDRLTTIGADVQAIRERADLPMFPKLRAQVIANPVTGEAYLLLDVPRDPPPPMTLNFTPARAYVPSIPSPISTVRDRLPDVLERTETTLQTLREIVARIPQSLDRTDRFFSNVERAIQDMQLREMSGESRTFFATTTAQIAKITEDVDRIAGPEGTLVKMADEAQAAIRSADVPGSTLSARLAMERASLAADDIRRSLPAIRETLEQLRELARHLEEQPESVVYGPRPAQDEPR